MRIELAKDFFVEVSEETIKNDLATRVYLYLAEVRKSLKVMKSAAYNSEEYNNAYHACDRLSRGWDGEGYGTGLLDYCAYNSDYEMFYNEVYNLYMERHAISQSRYREENLADFLEYESHKDEEGFDWDFYSDWHKDMYGYRPR